MVTEHTREREEGEKEKESVNMERHSLTYLASVFGDWI